MLRNKNIGCALGIAALLGMAFQAEALPTVGSNKNKKILLKTAAGCDPATATIDLDINNVRARIMTGGDMWWNQGTGNAAYEVPKGSNKSALFAGSVWVGGFTADKQLKVCGQTFRADGNDYYPGPLNEISPNNHNIDQVGCSEWDKFWKIDRSTINQFRELYRNGGNTMISDFQTIWEWPAKGNGNSPISNGNTYSKAKGRSGAPLTMDDRNYAPFVDVGGVGNDPELYNPELGDFPGDPVIGDLLGDQYIWWVFNDRGNTKGQSKTEAIGMEVQTGAFAFASKDFMNDATFYNYKLINWSTSDLDSTFMSTWTDADLGYAFDDYIGCDTIRGLGILYNGDALDGAGEPSSYGSDLPMVGVDFFRGPRRPYIDSNGVATDSVLKMTAFTYFNNGSDPRIGDPTNGIQMYNYMTGTSRNGQNFNNDYKGPGIQSTGLGEGPDTRFVFFGDPEVANTWSECSSINPPADRRFIHSAGPFVLKPGAINDITIGAVWVSGTGGCPNVSFKKIRLADDQAQILFDNNFKTIEGPEAPNLVKREMDKRIIFYLNNPTFSTNFQEKFGYELDTAKYRTRAIKASNLGLADSLYKFEGYRVFQLKSDQITPAQIFDETGAVNNEVAIEVFQSDIQNGVSQVVNWQKNIDIRSCDTCYTPVIKVDGRDSGIAHSFEISQDAFAEGTNKALVNYKTYYFVAIAYSVNNFANFDPGKAETTQDVAYLESAHGPGGTAIQVIAAMPNPFSNDVGTELNAWYGAGVVIKKLEGIGNGGNVLQLDEASEAEALNQANNYQSAQPTYEQGQGPVNIEVVDPVKVAPGNWSLYIKPDLDQPSPWLNGATTFDPYTRLIPEKAEWVLVKDGNETIYSERNLAVLNEQIVAKYGLSISIAQVGRPSDDDIREGTNGYITSDITFANPSLAWLAGVGDGEGQDYKNWIRSGSNQEQVSPGQTPPICNFNDPLSNFDPNQRFEGMLPNLTFTRATWAPYALGAVEDSAVCGFGITRAGSATTAKSLVDLHSVDIVFTSDRSKWTRAVVVEVSDDPSLAEGRVAKFSIRDHASWTGDVDASGAPIYSTTEKGFSMFPGYAINQETGQRLNIVFAEDSYLANHNGKDMIWNPTSVVQDDFGNNIFGGRHYVYISKTKYDGGDTLATLIRGGGGSQNAAYQTFMWAGMPTVNSGFSLLSLKDGLIPTETRLRFRVTRPYGIYVPPGVDTNSTTTNNGYPWYSFSTDNLAPKKLSDAGNPWAADKQALLDRIGVVPNPYYAYAGYEANRLDTRVRIINLPAKATIRIYSLDGALIRTVTKDNPNVSYVDWDIRNAKNLPIASGMYLMHVQAEGIGEMVLRWFGAMRPVDVTQY